MENYSCDASGANFKSKGELNGHVEREHAQQPSQKTAGGHEDKKNEQN